METLVIIILVLLGICIGLNLYLRKGRVKDDPLKVYGTYLFVYRIKEDAKDMPIEFLVDWKFIDLENHLYLLELNLETDPFRYLEDIWKEYTGWESIYLDVYEKEGVMEVRHKLIGKMSVVDGVIYWDKQI